MTNPGGPRLNGALRPPTPAEVEASVDLLGAAIRDRNTWRRLQSRQVQDACKDVNRSTNAVLDGRRCEHRVQSVLDKADRDEGYRKAMADVAECADAVHPMVVALADGHDDELASDLPHIGDVLRSQVLIAQQVLRSLVEDSVDSELGCAGPHDGHECVELSGPDVTSAGKWLARLDADLLGLAAAARRVDAVRRAHEQQRAEVARLDAETAAEQAARAAEVAQKAAGDAGSDALGKHFEDFAIRERSAANLLRWISSGLLVLLSIGAGVLVLTWPAELTTILARLAAGLPIAALAAYLASESSRHRVAARWSAELGVKLRTLPAYTEPLSRQQRIEYWSILGNAVFTGADGSQPKEPVPSAFDELLAMVGKLAELASALRGFGPPADGPPPPPDPPVR